MSIAAGSGPESNAMVHGQRNFTSSTTHSTASNYPNARSDHQVIPFAVSNTGSNVGSNGQRYNPDSDPTVLRERELESLQTVQTQNRPLRPGSLIQNSDSNQQGLQNH